MSIRNIESAIVNKLKTDITNLKVEPYPDNTAEYLLKHSKGVILVHYNGAKFKKSVLEPVIAQECILTWDIILICRNLRNNDGVYDNLDKIRESLTGLKPDNCEKMYPTEENFISEHNGIWQYGIRFQITTKHIEDNYLF